MGININAHVINTIYCVAINVPIYSCHGIASNSHIQLDLYNNAADVLLHIQAASSAEKLLGYAAKHHQHYETHPVECD